MDERHGNSCSVEAKKFRFIYGYVVQASSPVMWLRQHLAGVWSAGLEVGISATGFDGMLTFDGLPHKLFYLRWQAARHMLGSTG